MSVFELMIRTFVIFILLLVLARLLGRKLISQMTFFDFVSGITLGSVCANIIFNKSINYSVMLTSPIFFSALSIILGIITIKTFRGRKWINAEPTLLIHKGKINEQGLRKIRLTADALLMLLRKNNVFYLDDVDMAFMETDRTLSVLKKTETQTVTKKDMNVPGPQRGLPQTFIIDGKVLKNSLHAMDKDENWLETLLKSWGIASIKDIFIAQMDELGKVYIDVKESSVDKPIQ